MDNISEIKIEKSCYTCKNALTCKYIRYDKLTLRQLRIRLCKYYK